MVSVLFWIIQTFSFSLSLVSKSMYTDHIYSFISVLTAKLTKTFLSARKLYAHFYFDFCFILFGYCSLFKRKWRRHSLNIFCEKIKNVKFCLAKLNWAHLQHFSIFIFLLFLFNLISYLLRSVHISNGVPDPNLQASHPATNWVWPG